MAKNKKTNAMRMLDGPKIKYEVHSFEVQKHLSGAESQTTYKQMLKQYLKRLF